MALSRRSLLQVTSSAAVVASAFPFNASAQDRTIRLVVSYPAGGIADIATRLIGKRLSGATGQPVIVDNRAGASGRVATQFVRRAPPDGLTLLMTNIATMVIGPSVWKSPGFDPVADFIPVSHVIEYELAYAAAPNAPVNNLKDYISWVRTDPKNASFGSPAVGGLAHFLGLEFARSIKVDLTHIGYKGSAPLTNDLMSSQVPAGIDTLDAQVRARGAKILATAGARRSPYLPQVPTFAELGYPDVKGAGWFGFFAPAKTPASLVQSLAKEIAEAAKDPEVVERLKAIFYTPTGTTPAEFERIIKADRDKWVPLIKASGLVLEE
ncbi:Bug family tripartite tricarboxylate transporter substrate binding protein [Ramlibacter albus]|uniref:ABC transporter substrate-binding protein n=1 Tax=Ramlibacter albus TaxID=2079448 RepID=A0A923M2P2_9BURK|nr:tripartite tricarboxylate transporter substrate-binding protein [Ramlibacter albus]MBC5763032.1 ABC transporter substrate-binding protein [Ramlibacter albus]